MHLLEWRRAAFVSTNEMSRLIPFRLLCHDSGDEDLSAVFGHADQLFGFESEELDNFDPEEFFGFEPEQDAVLATSISLQATRPKSSFAQLKSNEAPTKGA
jgi:hypothetical protein